jgi:hypothetical protein
LARNTSAITSKNGGGETYGRPIYIQQDSIQKQISGIGLDQLSEKS